MKVPHTTVGTPARRHWPVLIALLLGLMAGAVLVTLSPWSVARSGNLGRGEDIYRETATIGLTGMLPRGLLPPVLASLPAQAAADLGDGDYLFLPNRRTIWVVNKRNGRFANYHFKDDEAGTVERSRVVTLDAESFPPLDTVYLLSDRNLTEVFWVCNKRTGDVQLWIPKADGRIAADKPIATSIDLMKRASSQTR